MHLVAKDKWYLLYLAEKEEVPDQDLRWWVSLSELGGSD